MIATAVKLDWIWEKPKLQRTRNFVLIKHRLNGDLKIDMKRKETAVTIIDFRIRLPLDRHATLECCSKTGSKGQFSFVNSYPLFNLYEL